MKKNYYNNIIILHKKINSYDKSNKKHKFEKD